MYNKNIPEDTELPSSDKLIKSTLIAAATAALLLVTVVLPAEYGIDPTGVGALTGLKKMGEIRVSLAQEVAVEKALEAAAQLAARVEPQTAFNYSVGPEGSVLKTHEMKVTLAPDEGTEIKLKMIKGKKANYVWWSDGGAVNFDVHADSDELNIDYHSYFKGKNQRRKGVIEAAFDGNHGWFWRNRTSESLTVTLQTDGEYLDIKHLK